MSWIQTFTGKQFYPLEPDPEKICIEDIAHALSMICRFTGHCDRFYSVAEHSVIISNYLPYQYQLRGLLHDASEAYLCDVSSPVKPNLIGYSEIEHNLQSEIFKRFGVSVSEKDREIVKEFDLMALAMEKEQLMKKQPASWGIELEPLNHKVDCWFPEKAEFEFLKRFKELTND